MLDLQWILDNLGNWRGLGNRRPETKGKYIGVLAKSPDNYFTRLILDIMESVTSRAEWDAMMDEAGSKRAIRVALDTLSAEARYSPRLLTLEHRWGINLHDDPPPPPDTPPSRVRADSAARAGDPPQFWGEARRRRRAGQVLQPEPVS